MVIIKNKKVLKELSHKIISVILLLLISTITLNAQVHTFEYYDSNVRNYFKTQKWEQGKRLLDQGIKEIGVNSVTNELTGWYYYHYKKYDQARFYLIKSLKYEPSNLHSREILINIEEETKNYSSAICYINEMLQYNPYNENLWRRKIDMYRRIGNNVEADRLLQRLRQIYPDNQQIKKDITYQTEINYNNFKKTGNVEGQLKSLKDLVKMQPENPDNYLALSNLYLQFGQPADAAEVAGAGAKLTQSPELVSKRVGILLDMGNYIEANTYLKEYIKTHPNSALGGLQKKLLTETANASVQYDPYIMFGKLYETQHSDEALTFLINTSLSRGYYDDALKYLKDERKIKGETEAILYKMFLVNRRLGNTTTANNLLEKIVTNYPKNSDALEEFVNVKFDQASELMLAGQYGEAIPYLEYSILNSTDSTTVSDATGRLYNCYIETKDFDKALDMLNKMKSRLSNLRYALMESNLHNLRGKQIEALDILMNAYHNAATDNDKYVLSSSYEEIAVPYIKALMARGLTRQAHDLSVKAVEICPQSVDILTQAISTSYQLGYNVEYVSLVSKARTLYPNDPSFIVKEAQIYALDKDYRAAIDRLRPYVEAYVGDSAIINAFSENSELYTLKCLKEKRPYEAMAVVDSALIYNNSSKSLLYTKGLIFEDLHEYDSAFVYQMNYVPSLMDFKEFKHHLEEILYKGAKNELSFEYLQFRPGSQEVITANANFSYTRKKKNDSYSFTLGYAGRDGNTVASMTAEEQVPGGIGLQPGLAWNHTINSRWNYGLSVAWANKYMPRWTAKAFLTRNFKNDWSLTAKVSWRMVDAYSKSFIMIENTAKVNATDPDSLYQFNKWIHSRKSMFNFGATLQKNINIFNLSASADLMYLNKKLYINSSIKGQLFPIDGNHSHVFVLAGGGNAPELSLIDRSMPASFSKFNSFVSCGGTYVVNRYLSFGLSGDWYTSYYNSENSSQVYLSESFIYTSTIQITTAYSNLFFIHGQIYITF